MSRRLRDALESLPGIDAISMEAVAERASQVLRPAGALQRLDEIAIHMAGWQATDRPTVERPAILVFAGDHGVATAGVSAYPADVTAAMLAAVRADRATINAFARSCGASLRAFDVGVGEPTGDIRYEAAMTPDRFRHVIDVAFAAVDESAAGGTDLLVFGELGIGNTTVAAAIAHALLGAESTDWVGRGTGVDDHGMQAKRDAVSAAAARVAHLSDPLEVMREIGGAELTAMAAACIRARRHRIPVVLDGYIATAAVLPLHAAHRGALDHCLVGHLSSEPGHRALLGEIGKRPLLDLDMRLGEGSGAAAAIPLVRMACAGVVDVPTFAEWFDS